MPASEGVSKFYINSVWMKDMRSLEKDQLRWNSFFARGADLDQWLGKKVHVKVDTISDIWSFTAFVVEKMGPAYFRMESFSAIKKTARPLDPDVA